MSALNQRLSEIARLGFRRCVIPANGREEVRQFPGLKLIRVKSADYSLLIMEDYFPILGQVNGRIEFLSEGKLVDLGKLKGFYVHRDNEFSLLIKEQLEEPAAQEGESA